MDVTGPPPLDKEKIEEIPVTVIEQEQVGKYKALLFYRDSIAAFFFFLF